MGGAADRRPAPGGAVDFLVGSPYRGINIGQSNLNQIV